MQSFKNLPVLAMLVLFNGIILSSNTAGSGAVAKTQNELNTSQMFNQATTDNENNWVVYPGPREIRTKWQLKEIIRDLKQQRDALVLTDSRAADAYAQFQQRWCEYEKSKKQNMAAIQSQNRLLIEMADQHLLQTTNNLFAPTFYIADNHPTLGQILSHLRRAKRDLAYLRLIEEKDSQD